jgi:2-polyprenyl-3-methyl-5-hydroxy-6-metoxy-1,4-benzoquinol methylase
MSEFVNESHIRTAPCPTCLLCGAEGNYVYQDQKDRLFGADGTWNLKQCTENTCGLIWLDPMPLREDIGKAYATYYTHMVNGVVKSDGLSKRFYNLIKLGYLAGAYNYQVGPRSPALRNLGWLLYLFPIRRAKVEGDHRYLQAVPQGRLLDVGCGSGEWLAQMRELGWRTEGLDFDENAVKVARRNGLEVHCGGIEQQQYPDESFDAVTLSHVIEHLPDPVGTLVECARVLKKGGALVVLTPNATSLSHRLFKQDWRGLEPPRHLHIFSNQSLPNLLARAGFTNVTLHPHTAPSVFYESMFLRRGSTSSTVGRPRGGAVGILTRLFVMLEFCMLKWDSSAADCMAAVAVK